MVKLINLNFEKFGWEQVFFIKSAHAIFFFCNYRLWRWKGGSSFNFQHILNKLNVFTLRLGRATPIAPDKYNNTSEVLIKTRKQQTDVLFKHVLRAQWM